MPIITGQEKPREKKQVRIRVDAGILGEVKEYCNWQAIDQVDYFFEQAASIILKKDNDWKKEKAKKTSD